MTNDAVTKMTADYIWKNRDKGWVRNLTVVRDSIPEIGRLWANAVRDELLSLEDCSVESEGTDCFEVVVSKANWGSRRLVFGCDSEWKIDSTWFGIYDEESTSKRTTEHLRLALDRARSDRSKNVVYDQHYPAYFYTQTFFDTKDMVKAIAEEAKRLTRKLDKALQQEVRPAEQDDES